MYSTMPRKNANVMFYDTSLTSLQKVFYYATEKWQCYVLRYRIEYKKMSYKKYTLSIAVHSVQRMTYRHLMEFW